MAEHKALKKALKQMKEGSRSAFHTFYLGSSQYIYSSALLLYDSHEDACRFMVDFYQYLYLHLPEYDRSKNLEKWISHLMLERYEQLSIGKNLPKISVKKQMDATSSPLSKSEQERIWRMLDVTIHFPKEPVRHSYIAIALFVSALFLAFILACRYIPDAFKYLQSTTFSEGSQSSSDKSAPEGSDESESSNESNIQEELEDLLNKYDDSGKEVTEDDSDSLNMQPSTSNSDTENTTAPAAPDTPQMPDTPQDPKSPQTPTMPGNSDQVSDIDSLEDLELQLHYGDDLLNAGSD